MKLVCEDLANHKFVLASGEVSVDEHGVIELEDKDAVEVLMAVGFKEMKRKKDKAEELKIEEPKAELQPEIKTEKKRFLRNK
jgi:hypothetical protein